MSTLPIADDPSLLTAEWLDRALAGTPILGGEAVESVEATPLGTGQMCDSVRLTVALAGGRGHQTMVAKLPASDETSRSTAAMLRSYEKEVCFYREAAAGLTVRTPDLYYADIDESATSFVLVLEDLAPSVQGDQLAGCSPEVAAAALRQLVGVHAPRWNDPSLAELAWLRGDRETERQMISGLLPSLWAGFLDRYDDDLDPAVREAGAVLFGSLDAYLAERAGPETITHGDFRLDNLLIAPDGEIAVVDWQTCSLGNPMGDVAYFIGAGLLPEVRRSHEDTLVRRYHEGLRAAGVDDYPWERCWTDHRRGTWAGLIMAVGASMLVERTDRGDQMFLAMARRHAQHALDLDAAELIS